MLGMIGAYLCIPRRLRFIARWVAACFVIGVFVLVLIFFLRVLRTVPVQPSGQPHPRPHRSVPPDFLSDQPQPNLSERNPRAH